MELYEEESGATKVNITYGQTDKTDNANNRKLCVQKLKKILTQELVKSEGNLFSYKVSQWREEIIDMTCIKILQSIKIFIFWIDNTCFMMGTIYPRSLGPF